VIRILDKNDLQSAQDFTLDPVSSSPVKQTHVSHKDSAQRGQTETQFEEWKMVQGIQFPHRISMTKGGAPVAVITVDLKLDSGRRPDGLASMPPDLSPVISQPLRKYSTHGRRRSRRLQLISGIPPREERGLGSVSEGKSE
jgi:hypothetical protein